MLNIYKNSMYSAHMIKTFITEILPLVNTELDVWKTYAETKMLGELQKQALASITDKKFHCQGGSFYSLYPGVNRVEFVKFVVALQTISDYLDNLCDRANVTDEKAFAQLHLAMTDALNPRAKLKDYYAFYPFKEDGGYLNSLVKTSQDILAKLPSYDKVQIHLLELASLYSHLQTYKHIALEDREQAMQDWLNDANTNTWLTNWEFAAATGSTLGMFMLTAAAYQENLNAEDVTTLKEAYFPWISCLHIQLDYFIDQAEDRQNNDLNFIFYYSNEQEMQERLQFIYQQAFNHAENTPNSYFATTIVRGLVALYLSDSKIKTPTEKAVRKTLLNTAGVRATIIYYLCNLLRNTKKI